ncbi:helix-turn-helix domain-containing protein [Pseudovibrio sp. Tun.PSC04-5.I4]|uniref:helix-turn-helix domain-containing protein n=1 Tax=Pseudovibrio sp. Tun.PSC04-5.I4 TaxID=1798213 RepID=UPI001FCB0726|nr:helix-turn-helix domain-containing protein [Pseudovibrio sp. Tun.PSC04-5.I4]
MYDTGEYSISDLAEMFTVSRPTVYRTLARTKSLESSEARKLVYAENLCISTKTPQAWMLRD